MSHPLAAASRHARRTAVARITVTRWHLASASCVRAACWMRHGAAGRVHATVRGLSQQGGMRRMYRSSLRRTLRAQSSSGLCSLPSLSRRTRVRLEVSSKVCIHSPNGSGSGRSRHIPYQCSPAGLAVSALRAKKPSSGVDAPASSRRWTPTWQGQPACAVGSSSSLRHPTGAISRFDGGMRSRPCTRSIGSAGAWGDAAF
mmetsp:Transcript_77344/g.153571  ORF Transcript_77344/g.153571 Transcript_77344/m.153571 type:complete len:201 (+) Transcript_77344:108-710(+)